MNQQSTQVQLQKEIRDVSNKLSKLEIEVRMLIKKIGKQNNPALDRGLRELDGGRGRLFKSLKQWSAAMKS